MALELKLDDKPFYWGLGIGLLLAALLAGGLEYGYFTGMRKDIKSKESELASLNDEIQKGRAAERKLVAFKEEIKKLELELDKLLRILPSSYNADELVKKFETLANQGELSVLRISSGNLEPRDFYSVWPLRLDMKGSYHNLALFFDKLSRFSRIINVDEVRIQAMAPGPNPNNTISTTCVAKTFIYTEKE